MATIQGHDLSDVEFWAQPWAVREDVFRALRAERPIAFFEEPEIPGFEPGPGYYAITRHADVVEMSRRPEAFCSGQGATSIVDLPPIMAEFYGSMISMDDPRHARLRGIVSRAFTPKRLADVLDSVEHTAAEVVAGVAGRGECDFTVDVAARLPLLIIMDMLGIPRSQYDFVLTQSNIVLSDGDPEYVPDDQAEWIGAFVTAGANLAALMQELADRRRAEPTDDLTSALVNADVDGEQLTSNELASFFILLVAAGNETTRTALSHGVLALSEHPDQRHRWMADFDALAPTAVEEIVRWASPVIWMRRTVTEPVEVGGHEFATGDKVLLFYNSANRDEAVFADPYRFDVGRDPNPHIGFGAPGPHFCLGAHLARREITVMFRQLFTHLPDLEVSGPPAPLRSSFINGIKHLPITFTPT
jgi:cytochrome P450